MKLHDLYKFNFFFLHFLGLGNCKITLCGWLGTSDKEEVKE